MAAITLRKGGSVGICRRFAQISASRHIHQSAYDKNPEDHPTPDDVIGQQAEKYWAPHSKTGVFGPPEKAGGPPTNLDRGERLTSSPIPQLAQGSTLEQQAWFRTNSDVDIDRNAGHYTQEG
ncbi:late embryogenesis abundant protein At5g17165 [Nymphaea colorata]|nr:late embryogenesis abundant protein At5g17165 [Nymphaea colorata]